MAQKAVRRSTTGDRFRSLFAEGRPVRITGIAEQLGVCRATVTRQMRAHGTFTSVNRAGAFCALPTMCRFDALGFCSLHKIVFFRDGNQHDAIVRVVHRSEGGVIVAHIDRVIGSRCAMQMLRLVRSGKIQRRKLDGQYVYLSADSAVAEQQWQQRQPAGESQSREQALAEYLAQESRDSVELLVKVLMTCLRHPRFNAKSVALSLIRRGEQVTTAQVRDLLERLGVRGKNS